jgi:arsenate reductase
MASPDPQDGLISYQFRFFRSLSGGCAFAVAWLFPWNMKKKVLFICVHNSARSQMAEAFLNQMCCTDFVAQSAGIEPGALNPYVVAAMKELGYDLSRNKTKRAADFIGQPFDYVITVCDAASAARCPVFPGVNQLHWSFPDPSAFHGTPEQKLAKAREVRDAIQLKITAWCSAYCPSKEKR